MLDGTLGLSFLLLMIVSLQGNSDHVSILKFIERNWDLKPLTGRSRDNLPNPVSHKQNAYVPLNSPAIGDLFDIFDFDHDSKHDQGEQHGEK